MNCTSTMESSVSGWSSKASRKAPSCRGEPCRVATWLRWAKATFSSGLPAQMKVRPSHTALRAALAEEPVKPRMRER